MHIWGDILDPRSPEGQLHHVDSLGHTYLKWHDVEAILSSSYVWCEFGLPLAGFFVATSFGTFWHFLVPSHFTYGTLEFTKVQIGVWRLER